MFLEGECTGDEFVWISEVFDEIIEEIQSKELPVALYKLAERFPEEIKEYHLINKINR